MIDIAGNRTLAETRRGLVPTGVLVAVGGPNKSRWIDRWAFYEERGCPLERWLSYGIELDNAVIDAGRPATFGLHLCRGNQPSRWLVAGGYDAIAPPVFGGVHADRLLLAYDDERSGTFDPLRLVPDDKVVVLGLVTTKTSRIETPKRIKTRLREASSLVDAERLALSPQCGFATSVAGNAIAPQAQRAKLACSSAPPAISCSHHPPPDGQAGRRARPQAVRRPAAAYRDTSCIRRPADPAPPPSPSPGGR